MRFPLLPLAAALVLTACATPSGPSASAQLQATRGNSTSGEVRFVQQGNKVRVSGEVRGLKPGAEHGFHVHDKGDCSSGDGMSTGGHYNPDGRKHGAHGQGEHHAGDLPSLKADAQGVARFSFDSTGISVGGSKADIVGRGLIVHRDPDDYTTQPTGNSGPRLACAVITRG
ncbi:MAG TPA: superoxide dismutase [Curvibacter sp.]|nr:superoxide dismutase [Curvibacter sp.]